MFSKTNTASSAPVRPSLFYDARFPRIGGIPIDVFWQTGVLPQGLWLPDQGVQPYRGRG